MKRNKVVLILLLALAMISICACGNGGTGAASADSKENETYVIGCSWMDLTTQYQATLKSYVDKFGEENYPGEIELVHMDGQSNSATQVSQMETLVSQGVDAILMVPYDRAGCAPGVEAAADAGIPVIELCQETNSPNRTSFVGSDHKESGLQTMGRLAGEAKGKGRLVVLEGPTGQDCVISRGEGMQEVLDENPDIEIVATKTCDWDRAKAMSAVENIIQSGMEFDMIYAQSDSMAMGAMEALKGTQYEGKVLVGGIDCIPDALQAIKDGNLLCSSFQNAPQQAADGLEVALKAARGEEVDTIYNIPFELVDSSNCDDEKYNVEYAK